MQSTLDQAPRERGPIRYRNVFRWRVMPPEGADAHGLFDRSFENKRAALAYQKQVKARFPDQPCSLVDLGRWYDALGRIIR